MSDSEVIVIEAGQTNGQYWKDLWRYRELFYFLSWRDILVRYKQTVLGIAWSVIRPFLTMIIFTVVFGRLAKMPSNGVPYPILVFAALLPWTFFSNSFGEASNSLVAGSAILTKIYFPRLIMPATSVIVSLVDFLISFGLLLILMVWFRFVPDWKIVLVPALLILVFITAFGAGIFIAALNVKYRDFRHVVPFIIQLGMYISPVGFSSSVVPAKWRLLYYLNPMAGAIDGFRWAILGGKNTLYIAGFSLSVATSLALLLLGVWYFRRTERGFADYI